MPQTHEPGAEAEVDVADCGAPTPSGHGYVTFASDSGTSMPSWPSGSSA